MTATLVAGLTAETRALRAIKASWRRSPKEGAIRALSNVLYLRSRGAERVWADPDLKTQTASWHIEAIGTRIRHKILLGTNSPDTMTVEAAKSSHKLLLAFYRQLVRHETGHARYTLCLASGAMMSTAQLQETVVTAGVPWELWNLFEDARIEHNLRSLSDAEPFGWRRFWDCTDTDEPSKMFWNHINNEDICTARTAKWNGPAKTTHPDTSKVWDTRELIADFWERACHAPDALAIVTLAQEWMRVFGSTVSVGVPTRSGNAAGGTPSPSGTRGVGSAPSPTSDASPITRTEYGTPYECKERERTERHKNRAPLSYYSTSMAFHQTKPISEGSPRYRDEETGAKERSLTQYVANTFRRLVSIRDGQRQRVSTSGSRLHVRNAMTCEATSFRSTLQRGGKRKLVLIMDMSGSMDYEFHTHGAAFLAGIQTLRRQGVIDATVLLSGGGKWCEVPRDFEPSHVAYLRASHGDESIKQCLNDHKAAVCAADTVLVYTDGNLTDGKVDAGQWRSVGVDLVGAVADQTDRVRREMEHHFSRVITAENGHQLATQVLDYITRHA